MDKLETLLKERYGGNYRKISNDLTYQINDFIWVHLNANYDSFPADYKSVSIYYDQSLVFYCGHRSVLNSDFLIDTILRVVDELISKGVA